MHSDGRHLFQMAILKLSVFFSILPLTVCGENSAAHKSVVNSTIK